MLRILDNCKYFSLVVRALAEVLTELGVEHEVAPKVTTTDDATYLIFTTHITNPECAFCPHPLPPRYICYNFEQLNVDREWPDQLFADFAAAQEVWDYSLENIKTLKERLPATATIRHVPFGWTESLRVIDAPPPTPAAVPDVQEEEEEDVLFSNLPQKKAAAPPEEAATEPAPAATEPAKDVDFLFVGALNETRLMKLVPLLYVYAQLRDKRVALTNDCWDADLVHAYRSSRAGLNLHYYTGRTVLEVHRILPLIANNVWVISEHSNEAFYDDALADLVTWMDPATDNHDLLQTALVVASLDAETMQQEVERRQTALKERFRYVDHVRTSGLLDSPWVAIRDNDIHEDSQAGRC